MFDKDAITALQESAAINAATDALSRAPEFSAIAALPSDYKISDLETFQETRRRPRGLMSTQELDSFASYTIAHREGGTSVFVDPQSMSATAVLNLGTPTDPGHADNKAKLALQQTAAYTALLQHANGQGHKQATIAEFLEDWADHLHCEKDGDPVATPRAIAAIRKITIEAMRKQESTEAQLSASRSAFESVQATSTEPLPTAIYFMCQPYADLGERTFVLRLGVLTGNDKPAINLRIVKAEQHQEDMAKELARLIDRQFDSTSGVLVMLGNYTKAQ